MKISEIRIDGPVMTKTGRIGRVTAACDDGRVYVLFGSSDYPENMQASDLGPVSDPCNGCQKLEATRLKADVGNAMDVLRKDRDNWKATAHRYCRNAAYWREELEKLQKEALADSKPLSEVVKCYIRVEPEKLLMSPNARAVVEYLEAVGSCGFGHLVNGLDVNGIDLARYLKEARDSGRIRLVNGKYEIVRD